MGRRTFFLAGDFAGLALLTLLLGLVMGWFLRDAPSQKHTRIEHEPWRDSLLGV